VVRPAPSTSSEVKASAQNLSENVAAQNLSKIAAAQKLSEHFAAQRLSENFAEQFCTPAAPKRRKLANLDDSEGEFEEEPELEEDERVEAEDGPPEQEHPSIADDMPPRKRLCTKTAASEAHPSYEVRRARKRPLDYHAVADAVASTAKQRKLRFQEHLARQSQVSIAIGKQFTPMDGAGAWSRIHASHRRALVNDICDCVRCGLFCINKAQGLAQVCTGRPMHSCGRAQLKKLNNGRNPIRGATEWPDGTHISVSFKPKRLDIL
jgi:hypothetical protein